MAGHVNSSDNSTEWPNIIEIFFKEDSEAVASENSYQYYDGRHSKGIFLSVSAAVN